MPDKWLPKKVFYGELQVGKHSQDGQKKSYNMLKLTFYTCGCLFTFFFFYLCLTACQDYFTHFEPSQSLVGAKMGDPPRKTI